MKDEKYWSQWSGLSNSSPWDCATGPAVGARDPDLRQSCQTGRSSDYQWFRAVATPVPPEPIVYPIHLTEQLIQLMSASDGYHRWWGWSHFRGASISRRALYIWLRGNPWTKTSYVANFVYSGISPNSSYQKSQTFVKIFYSASSSWFLELLWISLDECWRPEIIVDPKVPG